MLKQILILLYGLFTTLSVYATDEPTIIARLEGRLGQLKPDSLAKAEDAGFYADLQSNPRKFSATSIKNIITFSIDEGSPFFLKTPFKATLVYRLYYSFNNSPETVDSLTENQTLEISYDTSSTLPYSARSSFNFDDAVNVTVKIVSISTTASGWDPTPALLLTNEMQINRTYLFDCEANKVQQILFTAPQTGADEIGVYWDPSEGADEYDLEWAYIDNSAYNNGVYGTPGTSTFAKNIFRNNASRVTLNSTTHNYKIPLLYEKNGKLFFRVRAVQLTPTGKRTETNWSDYNSFDFTAGHQSNLNWQSATSFAEEGMRKSVIQYFDGSLRSRQTVTKDNTTNTTVVAESLYDYQGRPVIQVLPASTINTIIKHTPNFNSFLNSSEYYKDNYDKVFTNNDYCNGAAPALDPSKGGSAQYYSPQNPEKDAGNNKLIPDAKGFPYTETKYLQDNTGRIAAQSGVGTDHRLNSGHETKYYYGSADQTELDALFGTEAGDASHYFKNMVRDANGQYSVSYIDMHGRTIATALSGDLPATTKLDYLPSKQDSYITKVLTSPSNNIVKGLVIESSKGLLVSKAGNHEFTYSLLPEYVNIKDCKDADICYSCSYTLEITISDDCGNKQFGGTPYIYKDVVGNISTACTNLPALFTRNFDKVLEEGSYTITKKLTIRDEAIQQHLQRFEQNNFCKTVQDFVQEQKNIFLERTNNCATPCQTCTAQLGASQQDFITKFITDNGLNPNLAQDQQLAQDAYNKLLEQCNELCGTVKQQNYLDHLRSLMLLDVTPPYGQFADPTDYTLSGSTTVFYKNSIFADISSTNPNPRYSISSIHYKDADGNPAWITVTRNGYQVRLRPQQLTIDEFIANFQPSWAEALADNLHPEIAQYNILNTTPASNNDNGVGIASYDWDQDFLHTETFAEALQKGYLNPTNNASFTDKHPRQFDGNAANADPFFRVQTTERGQMEAYMNMVAAGGGVQLDIWESASVSAFCNNENDIACLNNQKADPFSASGCNADLDMAWRSFRALYAGKKDAMIRVMVNAPSLEDPSGTKTYYSYFADVRSSISENTGIPDISSKADVDAALQDFYNGGNTCQDYAQLWWGKLAPCGIEKLQPYKDQIVADLVTVCQKGTDKDHIMGASSIAPGAINTYKDFDEVLAHYVQLYNTDHPNETPISELDCNGSLLNFPAPYSKPQVVAMKPVLTRPDNCECDRLTALQSAFEAENKDADLSAYIARRFQTHFAQSDLDELLKRCKQTVAECVFLNEPIMLPPALQCGMDNLCVPCSAVTQAYNEFKTQYPGYLPALDESAGEQQGKINELFSHYMNKRFGFAKPAQEYLAFMDSCGYSDPEIVCDSLQALKDRYNRDVNPFRILVALQSNSLNPPIYDRDITHSISDGMLRWPKEIRDTAIGYFEYFQHVLAGVRYCFERGYGIEFSFKFLKEDIRAGEEFFYYTDPNGGFVLFRQESGPIEKQGTYLARIAGIDPVTNKGIIVNSENVLISPDPDLIFKEWTTIKFEVSQDFFRVYANGVLLKETPRTTAPLTNWGGFTLSFMHFQAAVDWTKIYDNTGRQVFFDDYLTNTTRQSIDPSFVCPPPATSCEQSFTNYFNQQKGRSYTFEQIDSLYLSICGKPLDVCGNKYSSDTLKQIVDSFYVNAKPGRVLHKRNTQEGQFFYNKDIIRDGMVILPDSIRSLPGTSYNNYQFDFNTFCTNNGYTIETRFKFLSDALYGDVFYLGYRSIQAVFNRDLTGLYIKSIDHYGYNYAGHPVVTIPVSILVDTVADATLNWMTVKAVVKPNLYELYYNGRKVYEFNRDPNIPIANQQNFGLGLRGRQGVVDWVRIADVNDSTKYFEDFNNVDRLATVDPSFICAGATNCEQAFVKYFNQKLQTGYTYHQIEALYKSAGLVLDACEGIVADTLEPAYPSDLLLCGNNQPEAIPIEARNESPCADSTNFAISRGYERYAAYSDSLRGEFMKAYINKCLEAAQHESFTVRHAVSEYHYTLYYYDQAGNLVKTVPPNGVNPNYDPAWLQQVAEARKNNTVVVPDHKMATQYRYNTLNQVVEQRTPDAGKSEFWYDRLGRLSVSQNAKQAVTDGSEGPGMRYSYTLYDHLSRITEVGQIRNAAPAMTNAISRNPQQLQDWFNGNISRREQTTLTVYDQSPKESYLHKDLSPYILRDRTNLRNRVSFTVFSKSGDIVNYDYAAFYNYDIQGNVDTLLQDYGATGLLTQNGGRYKRVAYTYDLISGKVNTVSYQPRLYNPVTKTYITQPDAFYHKYEYDAENRLTDVYTGTDELHWEHDAVYSYYKHGPLSRMVLGDQQVQGLDYAYTLQGWLKGVNSTSVGTGIFDAGADGSSGSNNHQWVGRDAFGFSLQYYGNDYTPIANNNHFANITTAFGNSAKPLYNGNISSMAVNIPKIGDARVYAYSYDQLNRITAMDAFGGLNQSNNTFTPIALGDYQERISYDANGNILSYNRNGNKAGAQQAMDRLTYHYKNNTNQLIRVRDAVPDANYTEDIDNQPANNYDYDAIGNLIQDTKEGISKITWTVYGKIESITKTDGTTIVYSYDAAGNRITKAVTKGATTTTTAYVRDAQGNVLSIYTTDAAINSGHFTQSELHLYGSSRLGIYNVNKDLTLTPPAPINLGSGNSGDFGIFERNKKFFELSNHLGNVLATVSDKKIGVDADNDGQIDYYTADVTSAQDYFPFGMMMPGRKYSTEKYRYGFNGKEKDKSISEGAQDYGMRINDSRLGRFLSVDPITKQYPELTPYQYASNIPTSGIDRDGLEYIHYWVYLDKQGNFVQKVAIEDFRKMTAEQISNVHHVSPYNFYKEYSTSFGKGGRGAQYTYFRQGDDGRYQRDNGSYWEMTQNDVPSEIGINGFYTGRGSITKYGGLRSRVAGTINNPYDYTQEPVNIIDKWALDHDKSQSILLDGGKYGISLTGYQGPLEDVRNQVFEGDMQLYANFKKLNSNLNMIDPVTNKPLSDEAKVTSKMGEYLFGKILAYKSWKISQMKNNNDPEEMERVTIDNYPNKKERAILKAVF